MPRVFMPQIISVLQSCKHIPTCIHFTITFPPRTDRFFVRLSMPPDERFKSLTDDPQTPVAGSSMQVREDANGRHPLPSPQCRGPAAPKSPGGRGHALAGLESLRLPASGSAGLTEERLPLGRAALQELHPPQGLPCEAAAAAAGADRPPPADGPSGRMAAEASGAAAQPVGPGRRDVPRPAEPSPQPAGPAVNAAPAEHQSPQLGAGEAARAEGGCIKAGGAGADPVGAGAAGFGSLAHVRQYALEACQAIDKVSRRRRDQDRAGVGTGKAAKLASVPAALRDDHRGLHASHPKPAPTQQRQQQQRDEELYARGSPEAETPELQRGNPRGAGGRRQRRESLLPEPSEEQLFSPLPGIHLARRESIIPESSEEQPSSQLHLGTPLLERSNGRQRRVSLLPEPLEERLPGSPLSDLQVGPAPGAACFNLQVWR